MSFRTAFNLEAFLDGITGAGLFAKLSWPGAPTRFISDEGLPEELVEQLAIAARGAAAKRKDVRAQERISRGNDAAPREIVR